MLRTVATATAMFLALAAPAHADNLRPHAIRTAALAATEGVFQSGSGPISTGVDSCMRTARRHATLIYDCRAWMTTWEGDPETWDGNFIRCDVPVRVYFRRGKPDGYSSAGRAGCAVTTREDIMDDLSDAQRRG